MTSQTVLLALGLAFLGAPLWAEKHSPPPAFEPTLPWLTELDEALEKSRETGKPILAEFR